MILRSRSLVRKVISSGALAILLLCAPLQLAAHEAVQEREGPTVATGSVLEWFAGLLGDLTAWFTGGVVLDPKPTPGEGGTSNTDGGGCLDPNGRCGG
jgi:hypothetical protein